MTRSFRFAFARVLLATLSLAAAAYAQIPKLAEIPAGLPAGLQASQTARRDALSQRKAQLKARVDSHNQSCGVIAESSPNYQSCAAEQSSLNGEIKQYAADVQAFNRDVEAALPLVTSANVVDLSDADGPLIVNPADLKTPERGGGPIEQPPAERVAHLRKRVAAIQQALIRLSKVQPSSKDRAEWESVITDASEDAAYNGMKLGTDLLTKYTLNTFQKGLDKHNDEIARDLMRLTNETDPQHRARMQIGMKAMYDRREEFKWLIKNVEAVKLEGGQVVDIMETSDWAAKKGNDVAKSLEGIQTLMQIALDQEKVQKWLKIDPVFGEALKFGSTAIQSTYDATAVLFGAARLKQMNAQDELYLARVKDLSQRMKSAMEEIKTLEKQMSTQKQ